MLGAALVSLAAVSSARANLLVNGGLEKAATADVNPYNLIYLKPGSTALPGWTITSGTVDLVPGTPSEDVYWLNTEGDFSVDLVGTPGVGGISQRVSTTAGTTYTLTFDFSVNPEVGPFDETSLTKTLLVQAIAGNGTVLLNRTVSDTAGTRTNDDMQWRSISYVFTAIGPLVTVKFSAAAPTDLPAGVTASKIFCGPVIDNVDLEVGGGGQQLPEPTSLAMLGAGAAALLRRRRRAA